MKRRNLYALWIFIFLLISCSDDSDGSDEALTQEQLEAISGMYNLSEYRVNPPQDVNNDGTFSNDLMTEMDCLSASILLREDFTYSKFYVSLNTTFITNGLFAIFCGDNSSENGTWDLVNGQVVLSEEPATPYAINGMALTVSSGQDLPGFQSQVFLKQ